MTTNYERIKNMSVEEMAKIIGNLYGGDDWCSACSGRYNDCYNEKYGNCHCIEFALEWLNKEAEE